MRSLLKLFAFVTAIVLIAISCQKVLSNESSSSAASTKELNTSYLKNWYVQSFVKTAEWQNVWAKEKNVVDWQNDNYHKVGSMEVIEYPLQKQKTSLLIIHQSLTNDQIKKLVNASLKRVAFIKNTKNEITVRELDYIPDWEYLQKKQFDIGNVYHGKPGSDFTGNLVVKNWSGTVLSMFKINNGAIAKKYSFNAPSGTAQSRCPGEEACMWYEDCDFYGDGFYTNCGEPYMDPNDCIETGTGCDPLGGGDPCQIYGCNEGGGSGGTGDNTGTTITNLLTNNCLKQLFNQLKDGALKDLLIAYTGSQHNLTVSNGSSILAPNQPGKTGPNNDNYNIDMLLNESLLISSSYEAATETMLHESIHAYFMGLLTSDTSDHANMLCNYSIGMIEKLQSLYPSLNYFDAASLVYSGFQPDDRYTAQQLAVFNNSKNDFFNAIKAHEANGPYASLVTPNNLNNTATGYHTGFFGTKFPAGGCP